MSPEKSRVDAYMSTVKRLEPDIAMLDKDASLASIAISMKRIADVLDGPESFFARLFNVLEDASFNHQQRMR
jgi:hypothetical protein